MRIHRWTVGAGGARSAAVTAAITMAAATALAAGPAQASARPAGPARASASTGWRVAYRHHYGAADTYGNYASVVAPGKNDAWAFGFANAARNGPAAAVRWNGRHWRTAALPSGLKNGIIAASAPSGRDIWAASLFGQYVLHWNGTKWRVAKRWTGTGQLISGITAFSSKNVWVFGTSGEGPGLGTWHYNGHSWTHITGAGGGIVTASAVSARNIWAIGSTARGPSDIIARYNGSRWRQLTASALKGREFSSVLAISRTDVWADCVSPTAPRQGRLLKWNGKSWQTKTIPWKVTPGPIVSDGHGGLWITAVSGSATATSWVLHRTRSGAWTRTRIAASDSIRDLARVPGTDTVWGTGSVATKTGADAAIYAHGHVG
jgi:hypothetical protein